MQLYNHDNMRGGTRSNRREVEPDSVHELIPTRSNDIFNALQRMTPNERVDQYILVNETTPNDKRDKIRLFNEIFHEHFNEDALRAREIMVSRMVVPGTGDHLDGGKTRRNRRRRHNRRSLKHKHIKGR